MMTTMLLVVVLLLWCSVVASFNLPKAPPRNSAFRRHQLQTGCHLRLGKSLFAAVDSQQPDDEEEISTSSTVVSNENELISSSQSSAILSILIASITVAVFVTNPASVGEYFGGLAQAANFPSTPTVLDQSTVLLGSVGSIDSSHLAETATTISTAFTSSLSSSSSATAAVVVDWSSVFQKALQKALGGGRAGASAAVVQVFSLMWLRTAMNYQYRYGGDLPNALKTLWSQGGIPRLYQGLPFALVQGPLTRFGDTAANVGILALLSNLEFSHAWPLALQTAFGSAAAGLWRIVLLPIDSSKTALQVEGSEGLQRLWTKVLTKGDVRPLYQGAIASAAATAVGHFPWFLTYNALNDALPVVDGSSDPLLSLVRSAFLGLCASCVSDTCSNSLRVIKTTKQTAQLMEESGANTAVAKELSWIEYEKVIKLIVEKDGLQGLFGRGLQTRLLTNAIQGSLFSVLWKYFQQV